MAFLDQAIDWANWADSSDKIASLKPILQGLGKEELNCVRGILQRKRKHEFDPQNNHPKPWKGPRLFTGCNNAPVRSPSTDVTTPGVAQPEVEPMVLLKKPKETKAPWFESVPKDAFIAFDVEACSRFLKDLNDGMMHSPDDKPAQGIPKEDEPRIPKAAYLSVVDSKLQPLMKEKIKHLPGTFKVDYYSKNFANISSTNQLKDGKPFHQVKKEFYQLSSNKIHITCGGGSDYRYLEISTLDFKNFDLQSFYLRPSEDNPEKMEPMSLRDIYFFHFGKDFQRGPHDATADAKATMKCFVDGYCKLDLNENHDFTNVPNSKRMAKKHLYWCATRKQFQVPCQCCRNVEIQLD